VRDFSGEDDEEKHKSASREVRDRGSDDERLGT
jgi:hypothetical protein